MAAGGGVCCASHHSLLNLLRLCTEYCRLFSGHDVYGTTVAVGPCSCKETYRYFFRETCIHDFLGMLKPRTSFGFLSPRMSDLLSPACFKFPLLTKAENRHTKPPWQNHINLFGGDNNRVFQLVEMLSSLIAAHHEINVAHNIRVLSIRLYNSKSEGTMCSTCHILYYSRLTDKLEVAS